MITTSPTNETYSYELQEDQERELVDAFCSDTSRPVVLIQGLGFVGAAMAAAVSAVKKDDGTPRYNVLGVDLPDERNYWKIACTNEGKPPIVSSDPTIAEAYQYAHQQGNLFATWSPYAYSKADIIVVDIHLDIQKHPENIMDYQFDFSVYEKAMRVVAEQCREDVLVIVETTVPPGTTKKLIAPIFQEVFEAKGKDYTKLGLAHSYERVMPGPNYLSSITDFYRVFSGADAVSAKRARDFLESFINTKDYPLVELHSTTASEMAKVLENSFRAMNIAFIQEWSEFAEIAEVDLFSVIQAIRMRPTHKNMMLPGFGVGGYCLTKDSLLADWSYASLFQSKSHLHMSLQAIKTNDDMPRHSFRSLQEMVSLRDSSVLLLGVSYLNDVADTRYTPAFLFHSLCEEEGASIQLHDSYVSFWEEKQLPVAQDLREVATEDVDIVVLAVRHQEYLELQAKQYLELFPNTKIFFDANNILSNEIANELKSFGKIVMGVGKGHLRTNHKAEGV